MEYVYISLVERKPSEEPTCGDCSALYEDVGSCFTYVLVLISLVGRERQPAPDEQRDSYQQSNPAAMDLTH